MIKEKKKCVSSRQEVNDKAPAADATRLRCRCIDNSTFIMWNDPMIDFTNWLLTVESQVPAKKKKKTSIDCFFFVFFSVFHQLEMKEIDGLESIEIDFIQLSNGVAIEKGQASRRPRGGSETHSKCPKDATEIDDDVITLNLTLKIWKIESNSSNKGQRNSQKLHKIPKRCSWNRRSPKQLEESHQNGGKTLKIRKIESNGWKKSHQILKWCRKMPLDRWIGREWLNNRSNQLKPEGTRHTDTPTHRHTEHTDKKKW